MCYSMYYGWVIVALAFLLQAVTSGGVQSLYGVFAVPLAARIHEGIVLSNRDRRTLLDKMIGLLAIIRIQEPYYFVADAYYASQKIVAGLLGEGHHLVSRAKSNAVAYQPYRQEGLKSRGRPRKYGNKIKLSSLFESKASMEEAQSKVDPSVKTESARV